MEQADQTPLMSVLLGIPIPVNSVVRVSLVVESDFFGAREFSLVYWLALPSVLRVRYRLVFWT